MTGQLSFCYGSHRAPRQGGAGGTPQGIWFHAGTGAAGKQPNLPCRPLGEKDTPLSSGDPSVRRQPDSDRDDVCVSASRPVWAPKSVQTISISGSWKKRRRATSAFQTRGTNAKQIRNKNPEPLPFGPGNMGSHRKCIYFSSIKWSKIWTWLDAFSISCIYPQAQRPAFTILPQKSLKSVLSQHGHPIPPALQAPGLCAHPALPFCSVSPSALPGCLS